MTSLALFLSLNAHAAAPTITGGQGYSNYTGTGTPIFYGGMVGSIPPSGDGTNTLDTCAANGPVVQACNTAAVYGTLILRVVATHADAGNLLIGRSSDRTLLTPAISPNSDSAGVLWNTICQNMGTTGGGADCASLTTSTTGQFKLFIDKNNNNLIDSDEEGADFQVKLVHVPDGMDTYSGAQGISDFTPYPGDEKAYIEDPVVPTGSLTTSWGSQATRVRVFISANNMTEATPASGLTPQDLTVVTNGLTLDNSIVDGLTNGQRTFFRLGIVDEGMNVSLLFPPAATDDCDSGGTTCKYAVTPDEVLGLLTNDVNCFVATAAYGSSLEPKIDTFREFRFKRLLPYSWGRAFVKWYYHYGPYLARYIHDKPTMRAGARLILWPAYGFTRIALTFGIYPAMAFTLMLLSVLAALPFLRVRKID
jgi:hypothetical protein